MNQIEGVIMAQADQKKSMKIGRETADGLSRLAKLLEQHTDWSRLSRKEIAEAVGFKNPNMITMIKQGDAKLPIDKAPAMARVLGLDPWMFFEMALEQYYSPAAMKEIMAVLPPVLSPMEKQLIDAVRDAGRQGKSLNADKIEAIKALLD